VLILFGEYGLKRDNILYK